MRTVVGKGLFDFGDRDGIGQNARLQHPLGVASDPERNAVWIADTFNSRIKRVDLASGEVSKFRISYELDEPGGLSLYRNKLFIANTNAHQVVALDLQSRMSEVVHVRET